MKVRILTMKDREGRKGDIYRGTYDGQQDKYWIQLSGFKNQELNTDQISSYHFRRACVSDLTECFLEAVEDDKEFLEMMQQDEREDGYWEMIKDAIRHSSSWYDEQK